VSAAGLAVGFTIVAGLAGAIQVAVNASLGKRIGVLEATTFNVTITMLLMAAIVLVAGRGIAGVGDGLKAPPWMWLGGVMGAIIVTAITYSPPHIGAFATIAILIAGQLVMATLIDAFGLFGLERISMNAARFAGLVLLAGGAALVLKR
jgi:transporter family-2 protein